MPHLTTGCPTVMALPESASHQQGYRIGLTSRGPAWTRPNLAYRDAASRAAISSSLTRAKSSRRTTTLILAVNVSEAKHAHSGMPGAHTKELVVDLIHVTRWHQLNVNINLSPSFVRSNERATPADMVQQRQPLLFVQDQGARSAPT